MKNIMKRAWEIFRTLIGDRDAKLSLALKQAWEEAKSKAKKRINGVLVKEFASQEAYENYRYAGCNNILSIVHRKNSVCADMTTKCKNWKTAVKKFFDALADDKRFDGWRECVVESCENGRFSEKETEETSSGWNYNGGWFYNVEENDGYYYVCVNSVL